MSVGEQVSVSGSSVGWGGLVCPHVGPGKPHSRPSLVGLDGADLWCGQKLRWVRRSWILEHIRSLIQLESSVCQRSNNLFSEGF